MLGLTWEAQAFKAWNGPSGLEWALPFLIKAILARQGPTLVWVLKVWNSLVELGMGQAWCHLDMTWVFSCLALAFPYLAITLSDLTCALLGLVWTILGLTLGYHACNGTTSELEWARNGVELS